MKLFVSVKPNAKHDTVERASETTLFVTTKAPPREGKANSAVTKLVANFLGVPRSSVRMLRGGTGRQKIFEII